MNILLIITFLFSPIASADKLKLGNFSVKEIVLPSEVEGLGKKSGSIFYNKSTKGKVLIPVNFWGEVSKTGLHYVPADTNFISALSMAGGPKSSSSLDNVKLLRRNDKKIETKIFDLSEGGSEEAYFYKLKPNDTIFVEKSNFYQERLYYTSLVSVAVTVLSGLLLSQQINNNNN